MSGSSRGSFRSVIPTSSVDEKFKYKYVSKYGMIGSSCLFVQILGVIIHSFSVLCFVLFVSLVSFRIGIINISICLY